ncbi:hypothetical protein BGP_4364 [Beggiatoa sp. PS]|nr:hypothetical protein BGP_4364 [Beggiatoa sp. PS]
MVQFKVRDFQKNNKSRFCETEVFKTSKVFLRVFIFWKSLILGVQSKALHQRQSFALNSNHAKFLVSASIEKRCA